MTPDIATVVNLGLGGFAIFIMWKMYDSSTKERAAISLRFKEKDQELVSEIDKRDHRNDAQQKAFMEYNHKLSDNMLKHINEGSKALLHNTSALQENTKIMLKMNEHLNLPPHNAPVIIQNNTGEK